MQEAEAKYRDILADVYDEAKEVEGDADPESVKQAADLVAERIVTLLGNF
jgi:hypothetical protein